MGDIDFALELTVLSRAYESLSQLDGPALQRAFRYLENRLWADLADRETDTTEASDG